MKLKIKTISLIYCILIFSCKSEGDHARSVFKTYKEACMNKNGKLAAEQLDKKTLSIYSKIVNYAINSDSIQIQNLKYSGRLLVLFFRQEFTRNELIQMQHNPKELFAFTVAHKSYNSEAIKDIELSDLEFRYGNSNNKVKVRDIKGYLKNSKDKYKLPIRFVEENGEWKMNVASLINLINLQMKAISDDTNINNQVLVNIVSEMTEKPIKTNIWDKKYGD